MKYDIIYCPLNHVFYPISCPKRWYNHLCSIVINMNTHSKHENFIGNVDDVTQSYFRLYSNKDDSSEGG